MIFSIKFVVHLINILYINFKNIDNCDREKNIFNSFCNFVLWKKQIETRHNVFQKSVVLFVPKQFN